LAPVVVSVDVPLDSTAPTPFVVSGTDFPGTAGSAVTIRLKATDGLSLATCGSDELSVAGSLQSDHSVIGTSPAFGLTRDVTATVTLESPGGATATSSSPIASLVGAPDDSLDQDLDGVLDDCDPNTYTFTSDATGSHPAATTALDGPGQPSLVVVGP